MRHIIALAIAMLPIAATAQNDNTTVSSGQTSTARTELFRQDPRKKDAKYLQGAVPEVNGKVLFDAKWDVPGKSADEIYDIVAMCIKKMTVAPNQTKETKIVSDDSKSHSLVAHFSEQLVFEKSALSIDYTIIDYDLTVKTADGHVSVTMTNIHYAYEMDREDGDGMLVTAEEWITDKYAINKKGDKLRKYMDKFRIGTIDLKNWIFANIKKQIED